MQKYLVLTLLLLGGCSDSALFSTPNMGGFTETLSPMPVIDKNNFEQKLAQGEIQAFRWYTLLIEAIKSGDQGFVRQLYASRDRIQGADINQAHIDMMIAAAGYKDLSMIKWLFEDPEWRESGFDLNMRPSLRPPTGLPDDHSSPGPYQTVLMSAIHSAPIANLEWMIQQGADLNAVNESNWNALSYAVSSDRRDAFELLIKSGLSPQDAKIYPPLFIAVRNNLPDWVDYLLEQGADLHQQFEDPYIDQYGDSRVKATVLSLAMQNQWNPELLYLLLDKGATPDRAEHAAAMHHYFNYASFDTPESLQSLDRLLSYKPNLNLRDAQGRTPIMKAFVYSGSNSIPVVQRFSESGVDLKAVDQQGKTVLMYAAESGSIELIQHLMFQQDLSSELGKKDNQGQTARDYAHGDLGRYLRSIPNR